MAKQNVNIDFEDDPIVESDNFATETSDVIIKSAARHAIKINDIALERNTYIKESVIQSGQLLSAPTKAVALFVNEYVPAHFPAGTYIRYFLTVNGEETEVVPINLHRNGIKNIKTSDYFKDSDSTKYVPEKIKSLYLKVVLYTPNAYETPFISNLKILTGGEIDV